MKCICIVNPILFEHKELLHIIDTFMDTYFKPLTGTIMNTLLTVSSDESNLLLRYVLWVAYCLVRAAYPCCQ